jgi:hypothetical protein
MHGCSLQIAECTWCALDPPCAARPVLPVQYTPSADEPCLPDKIGHYHTLYPLEDLAAAESAGVSAAWGVRTTCLKGLSSRDGHAYCLRVVCGKQVGQRVWLQ